MGTWKPEIREAMLNALSIVTENTKRMQNSETQTSPTFFLQCFCYDFNEDIDEVWYISESVMENVAE